MRVRQFDVDLLRADRDQLWAEAAARESAGESIRLDPALYSAAGQEQGDRESVDSIEVLCAKVLGDITGRRRASPDEPAPMSFTARREEGPRGDTSPRDAPPGALVLDVAQALLAERCRRWLAAAREHQRAEFRARLAGGAEHPRVANQMATGGG